MKTSILFILFNSTLASLKNEKLNSVWIYGKREIEESNICRSEDTNCFDQCKKQIQYETQYDKCKQVCRLD